MKDIEDKVDKLVEEFSKMRDFEKRNRIVKFIKELVGWEVPPVKLSLADLSRIRGIAVRSWSSVNPSAEINGEKPDKDQISATMWLAGVVSVLREKGVLTRIVEPDYDPDVIIQSVFED